MHTSTSTTQPLIIPRMPIRSTICAGATPVTLDGETRPAMEWADLRGLKWQTVKMRRLRGDTWADALESGLRKSTYMDRWIGASPAQIRFQERTARYNEIVQSLQRA
ncbi:hypothetical protein PMM47T1_24059 [Pseudomonas sp. M47T1]|nr:hypothetical protein PMM47T1_24059 [Pseudomonas sp. M47T1]